MQVMIIYSIKYIITIFSKIINKLSDLKLNLKKYTLTILTVNRYIFAKLFFIFWDSLFLSCRENAVFFSTGIPQDMV